MKHDFKIGDTVRVKDNALEILNRRWCKNLYPENINQEKQIGLIIRFHGSGTMCVIELNDISKKRYNWHVHCIESYNEALEQMLDLEKVL